MIEFPPEIPEEKLLRKVVLWAVKNRYHIPSLNDFAKNRSHQELLAVAKAWQDAGFGSAIEGYSEQKYSVSFALNDEALQHVNLLNRKTVFGRMKAINRSDLIALGALVVSVIALFKPGS